MSEMDNRQILKLNYYKKLRERRTEDVDGGCISLNLYRNTEILTVSLKRWRGDFRKKNAAKLVSNVFV